MEIALKKKIEEGVLIKISRMKPVIKPTIPHRHASYHELIFLSKGSGSHTINDRVYEVKPFDGYYLQPGSVHCWDFTQVPEGFVILFREELMTSYLPTLNSLYNLPQQFEWPHHHHVMGLVESFYQAYESGQEHSILSAHLNLIILSTLSLADQPEMVNRSLIADFYEFKKQVNTHFMKIRTVAEYADMMNMSVQRLNSLCKQVVHTPAQNLIKERILIEAKNLITHTSQSIAEIAYHLNFTDASNFSKFFKSMTTMTPLEYRAALH